MERNMKIFLKTYFIIVLFLGLYNFITYIVGNDFIESYNEYLVSGVTILTYFISLVAFIVFILSIVLIIFILKKGLPKLYLILPIFFIFYYIIWSSVITLIVGYIHLGNHLNAINELAKYDIIFYVVEIILAIYFIVFIMKKD